MTTVATGPAHTGYTCRYCRLPSDATGTYCPNCGAPVDVKATVSDSGWVEQPAVRDMAKIQFGQSYCQVEGTLVPSSDFALAPDDGVVFSHHTLLWVGPGTHLEPWSKGSFFNRSFAGMPLVLMRASGPGHVALSEDHPGRGGRTTHTGRARFPRARALFPGRDRQHRFHMAELACLASGAKR